MRHAITPIILLGLTASVLFFTIKGKHGIEQLLAITNHAQSLESEYTKLQREISSTKQDIEMITHDSFVLEMHARESLALAYPGDIIYLLPQDRSEQGRN